MALLTYDPLNVNIIIGNTILTGFAEGTMVTLARNSNRVNPYVGVKGETALAYNNDNSGTISITLQQQSPSNALLGRLARSKSVFDISVIDINNNGFRAGGSEAVIQVEPDTTRGAEIADGDRTWTIYVFDYTLVET